MLEKIEDNLIQCISFIHDILYHDIEVRNGYLYSCPCPDSFKLCKYIFLVNRIFQVLFTERNIRSTSNMDERILRFSEFINKGEKYFHVINKLWKEKPSLLAQQGKLNEMSLLINTLKEAATAIYDVGESSHTITPRQRCFFPFFYN
ncbi:hypothetical protein BCV72DRAFT_198255 [Rhizopus microsporus var. microsporus]|uniref:SWIM-type domain-containing protein n=1 Tax=Rhizopus microsporus var. microsporus TaxID=86635 RepID=A0A1X0RGK4_RHIZD|nr:hypothetical protein BCV72DRAFT_198255 [Rhizopus microsporus var. microsporus]